MVCPQMRANASSSVKQHGIGIVKFAGTTFLQGPSKVVLVIFIPFL